MLVFVVKLNSRWILGSYMHLLNNKDLYISGALLNKLLQTQNQILVELEF